MVRELPSAGCNGCGWTRTWPGHNMKPGLPFNLPRGQKRSKYGLSSSACPETSAGNRIRNREARIPKGPHRGRQHYSHPLDIINIKYVLVFQVPKYLPQQQESYTISHTIFSFEYMIQLSFICNDCFEYLIIANAPDPTCMCFNTCTKLTHSSLVLPFQSLLEVIPLFQMIQQLFRILLRLLFSPCMGQIFRKEHLPSLNEFNFQKWPEVFSICFCKNPFWLHLANGTIYHAANNSLFFS